MSFPKTLKAAKAVSFSVVAAGDTANDGGFLISEDHANNIEAALADNETQIANLTSERDAAQTAVTTANNATAEANTRLSNANTRITNLEAEVARLKAGPAGSFTSTTTQEDPVVSTEKETKNKFHTSVDDEAAKYARKK